MIRKIHIEVRHKFIICNSQMDQKEKFWLLEITIKAMKKAKEKSVFCSYCAII